MGKSPPGFVKETRAWLGVNVLRKSNAKSCAKGGQAPREAVKPQPERDPPHNGNQEMPRSLNRDC